MPDELGCHFGLTIRYNIFQHFNSSKRICTAMLIKKFYLI